MATFEEMYEAGFFLVISTVILVVVTLGIGPVIDWLAIWLPSQPAGRIPITPVQMVFGTFYGLIVLLEVALFVNLFLVVARRTDYNTGDSDF
jgi:hypothetical protein